MAFEYEATCQTCGNVWRYNDADLRENKRLQGLNKGRGAVAILDTMKGHSVNPTYQVDRMRETAQHIVDYGRCGRCGSMNVTVNETYVDNWLLDDPASPFFEGSTSIEEGGSRGAKSKMTAAILAFLLGWCGAHKFYLGYAKEGAITLGIAVFGNMILPLIAPLVMAIVGIVEGVIYITKDDETFNRTYVMDHKGWF